MPVVMAAPAPLAPLLTQVETLMSSEKLDEYAMAPPYLHMLTEVQRKVHNSDSMLGRLDRLEAMFHSEWRRRSFEMCSHLFICLAVCLAICVAICLAICHGLRAAICPRVS